MESPSNFGHVNSGIYRSSFPKPENFDFLSTLHLKSILLLLPEEYPEENRMFCRENNIQLFQVGLDGNKEPFVHIKPQKLWEALRVALDPQNQPLLIHCNMGKHRTGCLVGCIRRLQQWSLSLIFEEYRRYAFPKVRSLDLLLIELFDDENAAQVEPIRSGVQLAWS